MIVNEDGTRSTTRRTDVLLSRFQLIISVLTICTLVGAPLTWSVNAKVEKSAAEVKLEIERLKTEMARNYATLDKTATREQITSLEKRLDVLETELRNRRNP